MPRPPSTGYANALQVLNTWKRHLQEYEIITKQRISDFDKVTTVRDMMPLDLRRDIISLKKSKYTDVYSYITRQVTQRREEERRHGRRSKGGDLATGDEANEQQTESEELHSFQRSGIRGAARKPGVPGTPAASLAAGTVAPPPPSAGGIGLKAAFDGKCFNCDQYSHRANACPEPRRPRTSEAPNG